MDESEKQEVVGQTIRSVETGDTWMEIVLETGQTINISARGGEVILVSSLNG